MADNPKGGWVLLSVLDRLLDTDPGVQREALPTVQNVHREMVQAVRRDLENLLNTRIRIRSPDPSLSDLDCSLVNYGIPDFTAGNLASFEGRETIRAMIEGTLRKFEPRFKHVSVALLGNNEQLDRTLRFRIEALLVTEPAPEPIAFDSVLEPVTHTFAVKMNQNE